MYRNSGSKKLSAQMRVKISLCALSALNSGVTCRDVQSLWAGADTMNWLCLQRGKKRRPPASHITRQLPVNETQICLMSSTIEAHTHFFFLSIHLSRTPYISICLMVSLSHVYVFFLARSCFRGIMMTETLL